MVPICTVPDLGVYLYMFGEANEGPDTVSGEIVFFLQQKEHPKFKRKDDDLFVEHTLSMTEALCSYQFVLTHRDGRHLLIKSGRSYQA